MSVLAKYALGISVTVALIGCTSEVDKCVNSQVSAWKDAKERNEAYWDEKEKSLRKMKNSNDWEIVRENDVRTKNEIEAEARLICMSLAAKK
jgi:hypothetical protein